MVARINIGKSVRGALSYNENKVKEGKAEMILASRFVCELDRLGFTQKLQRFERLNKKAQRTAYNTIHISLNFSPDDQLSKEKMQTIAIDYMNRIGFGEQPFLVYRHDDTNHPHFHIVASTIRPNGRGINLNRIAARKSEPARKAIELHYGITIAQNQKRKPGLPVQPLGEQLTYGDSESKNKLSNIIRTVTGSYHFSSLDEYNRILRDFNVVADSGLPGSRRAQHRGLVYYQLTPSGSKVGIGIKASDFYSNPTLKNLEKKFIRGQAIKNASLERTRAALETVLQQPGLVSEKQLKYLLNRSRITVLRKTDPDGNASWSFVNHTTRTTFTEQELNITAQALAEKLTSSPQATKLQKEKDTPAIEHQEQQDHWNEAALDILEGLLARQSGDQSGGQDYFRKKRKKRKI